MQAERSGKSHAMAWPLALVILAPMLYVLSVVPLHWVLYRNDPLLTIPHPWFDAYKVPYVWMYYNMGLKRPMDAYAQGWWDLFRP